MASAAAVPALARASAPFLARYDSDDEDRAMRSARRHRGGGAGSDDSSDASGSPPGGAARSGRFDAETAKLSVAQALSDDQLPLLVAYQQLSTLASSTRKVQVALEQNRDNFERQLARARRASLWIAWRRWKLGLKENARRRRLLLRAAAKFVRATSARAFTKWLSLVDLKTDEDEETEAKLRMVLNFMRRRKVARAWYTWQQALVDSARERAARLDGLDSVAQAEDRRRQGLLRKALKRMANRKKAAALGALKHRAAEKRRLRALGRKCVLRIKKRKLAAAWLGFASIIRERLARKARGAAAMRKMANFRLGKAYRGYMAAVNRMRRQRYLVNRCIKKIQMRACAAAFAGFHFAVEERKRKRAKAQRAIRRMGHFRLGKAYSGYKAQVDRIIYYRNLLKKATLRMRNLKLAQTFGAWSRLVIWLRDDKNRAEMEASRGRLGLLEGESARLYEDNRRMAAIIDSGEWGKARVAELRSAGEVLSGEREALVNLLGRLRREYVATAQRAARQDEEMRALKNQMLNVSAPQRNRLVVRGASNFNALQRAIRQDAIDQSYPDALAVSKKHFTLDEVSIFPDGELHINPLQPTTQPFARQEPHGGRPKKARGASASARPGPSGSRGGADARRAAAAASSERVLNALRALSADEIGALQGALRGMDGMQ
eukprot:PRCOL_00004751-RA